MEPIVSSLRYSVAMAGRRRRRKSRKSANAVAARAIRVKLGPGPSLLQKNIAPSDRQRVAQLVVQALRGGIPVEPGPPKRHLSARSEKQRVEPL
jgi:hypothetical protein